MMRGETKNPKLKTLRKIAMGFNMTVSELLDFPEMNEMEFEDEWTKICSGKLKNVLTYENLFGIITSIRNATFPIER